MLWLGPGVGTLIMGHHVVLTWGACEVSVTSCDQLVKRCDDVGYIL